jgi:hypothetical protein
MGYQGAPPQALLQGAVTGQVNTNALLSSGAITATMQAQQPVGSLGAAMAGSLGTTGPMLMGSSLPGDLPYSSTPHDTQMISPPSLGALTNNTLASVHLESSLQAPQEQHNITYTANALTMPKQRQLGLPRNGSVSSSMQQQQQQHGGQSQQQGQQQQQPSSEQYHGQAPSPGLSMGILSGLDAAKLRFQTHSPAISFGSIGFPDMAGGPGGPAAGGPGLESYLDLMQGDLGTADMVLGGKGSSGSHVVDGMDFDATMLKELFS